MALVVGVGLAIGAGPAIGQTGAGRLLEAIKRQDGAAVPALLDAGADVNRVQGDGATALHWAVYWNDVPTTQLLLAAGATVGAANDLGVTPLWLACNNGSAVLVQTLLEAGADPNTTLPSGETALMTASRTGSADAVRLLLAHEASVDVREGSHGQTALMWAVSQGHHAVVETLLSYGAHVHERSDAYPQVISSSGNADRRGVYQIDQGGYTPLLFAARHGAITSARLLVAAGADVDDVAAMGTSALVVAAHSGHAALAEFLLEKGADPAAAAAGYTALHAAVLRGELSLVEALLVHGADPDPRLVQGTPARRVSADWGLRHSMIGATPLWLAARFRESEIMRVLADYGAEPRATVGGSTVVMAALQGGTTRGRFGIAPVDAAAERRRTVDVVALALEAGADVNGQSENGDTALHVAATRRLGDIIELLAARGAVIDIRNASGQTPLGLALSGPQGVAALYNPSGGSLTTEELLRRLGATDEGLPPDLDATGTR